MMLLTTAVREQLRLLARDYPLGLSKLEPGDVQSILLPQPVSGIVTKSMYRTAVTALLEGETDKSMALADRFVGR